jgi:hypothetical protein
LDSTPPKQPHIKTPTGSRTQIHGDNPREVAGKRGKSQRRRKPNMWLTTEYLRPDCKHSLSQTSAETRRRSHQVAQPGADDLSMARTAVESQRGDSYSLSRSAPRKPGFLCAAASPRPTVATAPRRTKRVFEADHQRLARGPAVSFGLLRPMGSSFDDTCRNTPHLSFSLWRRCDEPSPNVLLQLARDSQ